MSNRVAVVAVHGVAYHEPGSSANAVSGLLLGLREQDERPKYASIAAETIHIPLQPLEIPEAKRLQSGESSFVQKWFEPLEERTSFLTRGWRASKKSKENNAEVADDFMRLTLQDYRGMRGNEAKNADDTTTYITTRLKTVRAGQAPGTVTGPGGASGSPNPPEDSPPSSVGAPKEPAVASGKPIDVDVYEMYWADLSRPKGNIVSFFSGLYQLLFHLASLSRLAISTGYLENHDMWQWRALDRSQVYAVRMLTLPIPILNVLLLSTLFGAVPRLLPGLGDHPAPMWAAIGAAFLGILGYAAASGSLHSRRGPLAWALYPLVFTIVPACLAYWAASGDSRHIVLSIEGLAVGSSILYFSVNSYDDMRDGAKESAAILCLLWILAIVLVWAFGGVDSIEQAILWTIQIVLGALRFSWVLLFLFAFAAWVLGEWAWRGIDGTNQKERQARAKAAVRTSRFTLAIPTLGILVVTLALYSGLFIKTTAQKGQYGDSIAVHLFGNTIKTPLSNPKKLPLFVLDLNATSRFLDQSAGTFTVNTTPVSYPTPVVVSATSNGYTQTAQLVVNPPYPTLTLRPATVTGGESSSATVALNGSTSQGQATVELKSSNPPIALVPPSIAFTQGLSVASTTAPASAGNLTYQQPNEYFQGLLIWSATPGFPFALVLSALGLSLLILWVLPSIFTESHSPIRSTNSYSLRMGEWLSRGLDSTKIVAWLTWCAAFVVPSVFAILYDPILQRLLDRMMRANYQFIHITTETLEYLGLIATSAAVLAALASSGSSVLGIILDVDNYLRTSQKDATPRARIMERYVSLLRYLSDYQDPADGKGYDRVVIVAHSLGALISADLLRFLKVQSASPNRELLLFTMGNPLRQLLNRFFPYLYEWVHPIPDNSLKPLAYVAQPQAGPGPVIGHEGLPDPELLGVERWVSAYRSGDYVGRSLWLDEWYGRDVSPKAGVYVATEDPPGRREEMCIGAGAHQHYWDQSAPDIAEKLDELIQSVVSPLPNPASPDVSTEPS